MNDIVFHALDDKRAEIERHRENSSRMAEAVARFRTTGQGSVEFPRRVDFGVTFMEKPIASYSAEIDLDALDRLLETDPSGGNAPTMPIVSGFVTDWDTDHRGYYVGAFCGARVWYPPSDLIRPTMKVEVQHHFRFSAVGMKDIPTGLTD